MAEFIRIALILLILVWLPSRINRNVEKRNNEFSRMMIYGFGKNLPKEHVCACTVYGFIEPDIIEKYGENYTPENEEEYLHSRFDIPDYVTTLREYCLGVARDYVWSNMYIPSDRDMRVMPGVKAKYCPFTPCTYSPYKIGRDISWDFINRYGGIKKLLEPTYFEKGGKPELGWDIDFRDDVKRTFEIRIINEQLYAEIQEFGDVSRSALERAKLEEYKKAHGGKLSFPEIKMPKL